VSFIVVTIGFAVVVSTGYVFQFGHCGDLRTIALFLAGQLSGGLISVVGVVFIVNEVVKSFTSPKK
jgi:hypothetical protein